MSDNGLGRRVPSTWDHVTKYPLRSVQPTTVTTVERILRPQQQYRAWYDQGQEGACFPAGTFVRMADGTSKPIEEVRTLDRVVTAEGRTGLVMRTIARPYAGELVSIKLRGHRHLAMTPEHPVLLDLFGYTPAKELALGQAVALTRYIPEQVKPEISIPALHRRSPSHALKTGAVNTGGVISQVTAPATSVALTPAFGRLMGLFLAEGGVTANRVVWTFGKHERDTLVAETVSLIAETCGATARVQERPHALCVVLYGKHWREAFQQWCSFGPYDKGLPADMWQGGPDFLSAVLYGWLAGDGSRRRTVTNGATVSHRLALTMFDIAQGLGLRPTIRRSDPPNRRQRWDIEISDGLNPHSTSSDTAVYRRVEAIERSEFQGFVFNLEVDGDQSYVAEGIAVHNCVGYACSWMMSILNRKRYAAQWLYREAQLIDEWPDTPPGEGTSVRAAFDILRTIGHRPMWGPVMRPQFLSAGIESNRWARTVDELRTTIAQGVPGVLGINWYASFDTPEKHNGEWWIGRGPLGRMRGGHGIAYCAASDRREALQLPNSWGERYPDVWIPYDVVQRLINEDGEAGVIVDRPDA